MRHVLVEVQVVLLVKLIESLGEAHIQLRPRVRCPVVGRGADQGFNVGHKVLGEVRGLGKLNVVLGRRNGTAGNAEVTSVSTSSLDLGA